MVPAGVRVYAIGDVHGRADLLEKLVGQIMADDVQRGTMQTEIVLLGDLIDRGPDSAGVIDYALHLRERHPNSHFLLGNHEEVMLHVLEGNLEAMNFFRRIGGIETMMSYGIKAEDCDILEDEMLLDAFRTRVPQEHIDFLKHFQDVMVAGDYVFVHAGIRPGVPLDSQKVADLRWIREPFLNHKGLLDHVVIHGHTISEEVDERAHRVGIDTGAFYSDRLTAVGLEGTERWFLST